MTGASFAVAALVWAACASGQAADAQSAQKAEVADSRLSEPGEFARYVDLSRLRGPVEPAPVRGAPSFSPATGKLSPPRPAGSWRPVRAGVPLARAAQAMDAGESKPDTVDFIALAAAPAALALLLLGASGARGAAKAVASPDARLAEETALDASMDARQAGGAALVSEGPVPDRVVPQWLPASEPRPLPASSALSISAEEQKAIEQWDLSPEKSRGLASLAEWLDRHAGSLAGVDVASLKLKLQLEA